MEWPEKEPLKRKLFRLSENIRELEQILNPPYRWNTEKNAVKTLFVNFQ